MANARGEAPVKILGSISLIKQNLLKRVKPFYHQMVYSMFYSQLGSVRMCKPPRASCSKGASALETIGTIVMVKGFPAGNVVA